MNAKIMINAGQRAPQHPHIFLLMIIISEGAFVRDSFGAEYT